MENYINNLFESYKIALFVGVFILAWIRVKDISFFMVVILRALRIDYTDKRFDSYDEELYNLNLFRLKQGVNVSSLDDALIVNNALHGGQIEKKLLWFSGFFGPIGVKRTMRVDSIVVPLYAIFIILLGISLLYSLPPSKSGYATYNSNPPMLISLYNVYDSTNKNYFNKIDCLALKQDASQALKRSCNYITSTDETIRSELKDGIESEKMAKEIVAFVIISALMLGSMLTLGFSHFMHLNTIVCDLKFEKKQ